MNLKELIAERLEYHEVTEILFFDKESYYFDATLKFFYRKFPHCSEEMVILGEGQIIKFAKETKKDCSEALREMKKLIFNGVAIK